MDFRPLSQKTIAGQTRNSQIRELSTAPSFRPIDEIAILKKEKQNLIQEKSLLKAKIVRMSNKSKRPKRQIQSNAIQNNLEKEMKQIEQLTASKRSEIAFIRASDRAAIVDELQEECLMLHMEIIRMKKEKIDAEQRKRQALRYLNEAKLDYSQDVYDKQKREIQMLQKEIQIQQERNSIISTKLKDKEDNKDKPDERELFVRSTLDALDKQIQNEENQIIAIGREIENTKKEQEEVIKELEEKLHSIVI